MFLPFRRIVRVTHLRLETPADSLVDAKSEELPENETRLRTKKHPHLGQIIFCMIYFRLIIYIFQAVQMYSWICRIYQVARYGVGAV